MSCLGMPMTDSQTFPLQSINLDIKTAFGWFGSPERILNPVLDAAHPLKYATIMPFIVTFKNRVVVGCVH